MIRTKRKKLARNRVWFSKLKRINMEFDKKDKGLEVKLRNGSTAIINEFKRGKLLPLFITLESGQQIRLMKNGKLLPHFKSEIDIVGWVD